MIQSGTVALPVGGDPLGAAPGTWSLSAGSGDRTYRSPDIRFDPPFADPPIVLVSLAGVDADAQFNLRIHINAEVVQAEEFNIRVSTWADTLLYSAGVAWVAYDAT